MRGKLTLLAGICVSAMAIPAYAQDAAEAADDAGDEIIVTAQRTDQRLQDVPIAVSAFSSEALEKQQIKNTSDLQLTLPNVTFTKTNFTSSSFTIRGVGDLCVGTTCDQATAIHMNDAPLFSTRLFEGEFYDMAQIEVLRGPQGTLFGRNATSGVVNFRTARPSLSGMAASAEVEYGNYDSVKLKGMVNVPVADVAAVRLAGFYLNRDGYTRNLFDNSRVDDRDMYGFRGSIRIEPTSSTTIDLMAQYFRESDHRLRIQKQMCQRDPTGVVGCLNGKLRYETVNANANFAALLTSREFFAIRGLPTAFALGSVYGTGSTPAAPVPGNDAYNWSGAANPADPRAISTDTTPQYKTDELIVQARLEQDLGSGLNFKLGFGLQDVSVDSRQDYNLSVQNRALYAPSLALLQAAGAGLVPLGPAPGALVQTYFAPVSQALIPNGAAGQLCSSQSEPSGTGVFGGHAVCAATPLDYDRSVQQNKSWTLEGIVSSDWDGKFNFLLGGIYGKYRLSENSYYVNSFPLDYFSGVAGALSSLSAGIPPSFLASPFFRSNTDDLRINSFGIFGEGYYQFNDQLKLTVGLRFNNDKKRVKARSTLFFDTLLTPVIVPHGSDSITDALGYANYDFDPSLAGVQEYSIARAKFNELTGRAVIDYQVTDDNLVYVSYSRGYKSGGINPPLSGNPVPTTFKPEFIDAFEIGSKNTFGKVQLNLTGFYYKYKGLQLSRIIGRTSVNDNVDANIWGLEGEAIMRPVPGLTMNLTASYLNTEVASDKLLANPRDYGGGRSDAVILKDLLGGANCAVASTSGSSAGVNAFVGAVNGVINAGLVPGVGGGANLQTTTYSFGPDSGIASTGAFSLCSVMAAAAGGAFSGAGLDPAAFGGIEFFANGIPVNLKGNKLPGAPDYKLSAGIQYEAPLGDMTLTPRVDVIRTGKSTGSVFNGEANRISGYTLVNAQVELNGEDKRWFARAWVQNLFDKNALTGLYVSDQSTGGFTNTFWLEPRRYGLTVGIKF